MDSITLTTKEIWRNFVSCNVWIYNTVMVDVITSKEGPLFQGSVRELRLDDLDSLRPILSTWIKDRDTGETLPGEVEEDLEIMGDSAQGKNDRKYFVAEDVEGKVIGVIGFKNPDPRMLKYCQTSNPAELVNAYVSADQRAGKGAGKALVAKLEAEAIKEGRTEIVLNSGPRYKETGWGFYDKLPGYQRVRIAVGYYGEGGDAPVWRKEL
ncbi:hypothetical protein A2210_02745 [Candidatus Woesebacteria bacterium RIFOXYA1_FULL_40_18]|uniref:N-acetyltransferase domain-containing protein n=3 Tax=Candidatus Woeseibacteriota TaxID=1752722 RepID=A0A0G0SDZ0_9BACT|nr:MAG: hypothetical protein UU03_C0012G0010 [Candidatus Woesebacteria bacterium GW2011_GWA1_40_45]OGM76549.1 MAG: hypothetical protein A2210_02745 [Candidatus Woesebacteria bacterium RIFOXYA1_FULL_40_18]